MSIEIRELNVRTELINTSESKISEELYDIERRILRRVMAECESLQRRKRQESEQR